MIKKLIIFAFAFLFAFFVDFEKTESKDIDFTYLANLEVLTEDHILNDDGSASEYGIARQSNLRVPVRTVQSIQKNTSNSLQNHFLNTNTGTTSIHTATSACRFSIKYHPATFRPDQMVNQLCKLVI